jgi:hypothetical protein
LEAQVSHLPLARLHPGYVFADQLPLWGSLVKLGVNTIPLLFVWVGHWLSETDSTDVSVGFLFRSVSGKVLMFFGWVIFARLVGGMVIAPIILKMD